MITHIVVGKQFRSERNQTIGSVLITIIRNRSVVGLRQDIPAVVISIVYLSVRNAVFTIIYSRTWYEL